MATRPWWGPLVILAAALPAAAGGARTPSGADAAFLTRVTYGVRPGDLPTLTRLGRARWIDTQLGPPPAGVDGRLAAWPTLTLRPGELKERYPYRPAGLNDGDREARRVAGGRPDSQRTPLTERAAARITRAVHSEAQIEERLAAFWLDHFNVYPRKTPAMAWLLGDFEDHAIRPHLFGRFRTLLGAVAHSPAMLVYLDNEKSAVSDGDPRHPGINENYARELLELHTLGVDGGYTQADVEGVARILTGWGVAMEARDGREAGSFLFRPRWHDPGPKEVLGVHFAPAGEAEGEALLDLLAAHPVTVRRLSARLCRAFVGSPSAAMVDRVSARWTTTDGDLRAVVRGILEDPEILEGRPARSPLQWLAAALRGAGVQDVPAEEAAALVEDMGQDVLGALPPTGYDDTDWLSADGLVRRMVAGRALGARLAPAFRRDGAVSPAAVVDRLLPGLADPGFLGRLGDDPDVGVLVGRVLASPEFQRR